MQLMSPRTRHSFDVVTHLVMREVRLRYRRSLFGWIWTVAQPLSRFLVLSFVFTQVLPLDVPDFALFLFSGLIGWMWFAAGLQSATESAVDRQDLLLRPGVSPMLVPVVSVLGDAFDFVAALPILVVILLFSSGVPVTWLLLPVFVVPMLMLILGLGYALCSANVYLRDVRIVVAIGTMLGFYMTPVFYNAEQVPEKYRWIVELNPVAQLLEVERSILIYGVVPSATEIVGLFAFSSAILVAGALIYRRASPTFTDEL